MKSLITLAVLSLGAITFQSSANDQALVSAPLMEELAVEAPNAVAMRPCCYYGNPEPRFCEPYHMNVTKEEMLAAAKPTMLRTPIYVGGARYSLTKSDFNPIYETRIIWDPCMIEPIEYRVLKGYEVSFPVDGDIGQELIFDITGVSNKSMSLSASCGSFSGSDSGTKYIISKRKKTNGSCRNMNLKFSVPSGRAPNNIDLNVTISEQI